MNNDKDFILIEEYLDGTLQGAALQDFETRLNDDNELAEEIAIYEEMNQRILEMPEKTALQNQWKAVINNAENGAKEIPINRKKQRGIGFYLLRVAAVLVLGVLIYLLIPKQPNTNQLAMNYWEKTAQFQFVGAEKGGENNTLFLNQLNAAYSDFGANNYPETIEKLTSIGIENNEILLLKGGAYFQLNDFENAITTFQKILKNPEELGKDEANWYLALSFLATGNLEKGKPILEEIVTKKTWQFQQAAKILEEI